MISHTERTFRDAFAKAGIEVNGSRAWDIQVRDQRFYDRVLGSGTLGFGESYMDGWWDAQSVDQLIVKILEGGLEQKVGINPKVIWQYLRARVINLQRRHAFEVGERHYDIGNDLYEAMLGKRLVYSCGYWKDATTLDEAQEAKLDLVCRKIDLQKEQHVLDIGSGWGSFLRFAAEKYGVSGTGLTVSRAQKAYADEQRGDLLVETLLQDYHEHENSYDHVISIGMFEHVGYKNYRSYMEKVHALMKSDGYFLLHTIGGNKSTYGTDPWIEKYIFPNGLIPSIEQIGRAAGDLFSMEDWHNFGPDYDRTLMAWFSNFNSNWDLLKSNYDDRFYRMWKYYLLSCAASFRVRNLQLWQIVFSKIGTKHGYVTVR